MVFLNLFSSWKVGVRTHLRHDVYYPGNVVEGFVEITCTGPISMVAVRVKATGKEKVIVKREKQQGMNEDGSPIMVTETLTESCSVYKQLVTLAGQTKFSCNRQHIEVPPGRYTYPFAFQLPVDIPPSFMKQADDDMAHIAYHIKAYVDIPMGRDAQHRSYFTVVKPMPQNQWIARAPSTMSRDWNITFCCCIDKGNVKAKIFMDRTHISIDRDNLVVCADIDNSAGQEPVKALEINLMHKLIYKAGWVTETNVINEGQQFIRDAVVPPGGKGRIAGTIPLPRGLIPTLQTFNVTSEYWIDIELDIPWASDPKHRIPVIIAQAVDDTNFTPQMTWGSNPYTRIMKGQCPEFYYQPPQNPCYQLNPIPCQPPTSYQFNMFQLPSLQLSMPLPVAGVWSAPNYNIPIPPNSSTTTVTWQGGYVQPVAPPVQMNTVQITCGADAYGTESNWGYGQTSSTSVSMSMTTNDNFGGNGVSKTTTVTTTGGGANASLNMSGGLLADPLLGGDNHFHHQQQVHHQQPPQHAQGTGTISGDITGGMNALMGGLSALGGSTNSSGGANVTVSTQGSPHHNHNSNTFNNSHSSMGVGGGGGVTMEVSTSGNMNHNHNEMMMMGGGGGMNNDHSVTYSVEGGGGRPMGGGGYTVENVDDSGYCRQTGCKYFMDTGNCSQTHTMSCKKVGCNDFMDYVQERYHQHSNGGSMVEGGGSPMGSPHHHQPPQHAQGTGTVGGDISGGMNVMMGGLGAMGGGGGVTMEVSTSGNMNHNHHNMMMDGDL